MTPKPTTINTVTLTCSACGSSAFSKIGQNEYRCNHCQATTLVEDDVAQRLEKILRGLQQPPAAKVQPRLVVGAILIAAAVIVVPLVATLVNQGTRSPSRPILRDPPIDVSLVRLTDVQEIERRGGEKELLMVMRNETGKKIDAPRVTATFTQGNVTLNSDWGSPLARTLQPGEYSPLRIRVPREAHDGYTLKVSQPSASRSHQIAIDTSKVQLVKNDGDYRLVGLLTNQSTAPANSIQVSVVLYAEDGRILGTGSGYGTANELAPQATTSFDVRCDILREGRIAYYDYMVQSEK